MAAYSVNEIIEMAVQIERNGYAFYNEAAQRKDLDDDSRNFIIWLRDAELDHEKTFLRLRDEIDNMILELSTDWDMVAAYLKTIVESRIFNSEDSAIRKAAEAKDLMGVIDNAITFEKDTLLYFHAISDGISNDKAKTALRRIINEEVSHVLKLNDFKKKLS
ncbi:MAG TPA: ferritin family protein [Candidatus Cloacimonadota bacterium]|jgi:rubrerythrin|nr:ferritin family protein [Candidatus Cloacimonadota bacterium]HPW39034.1 ferritin family protein [Candidatus Syntrophosphaera sp.]HOR59335.1 ferritin family protein [Candidatus Cloacimonadota bacterium]HPB09066.1 ferritin family protein [Candidatus Cloacimonadota bacterium]HPL23597.1 ferritin family protein [Candidatus Cloacimonadota bacterium]